LLEIAEQRDFVKRVAGRILVAGLALCLYAVGGSTGSGGTSLVSADAQGSQISSVSRYLVARIGVNDTQTAKRLGNRIVTEYLSGLSSRVKFLDKDYEDIAARDCGENGICEVIQITIDLRSSWVTYTIKSHLLPEAPDRPIWDEKDPLSCDINPQHPAPECEEPMLHILAKKVLSHDVKVHRSPL
jgi:hypothetical protein